MFATLGDKRKAKDINARLLWTKRSDISWALEVCCVDYDYRSLGFTKSKTTGVIFVGGFHENDPAEVWATMDRPANHLETVYTCIFVDDYVSVEG